MIICIIGKTGAGKTTIAKAVSKDLDIPLIKTYTSRPMRDNETEDDYNFVSKDYFEKNKKDFIDIRSYTPAGYEDDTVWYYGIKKKDIKKRKKYIVVTDTEGFKNLSKHFETRALIIESPDIDIIERLKLRGDKEEEITRRLKDDEEKIEKFIEETPNYKVETVFNNAKLHSAINSAKIDILTFQMNKGTFITDIFFILSLIMFIILIFYRS